MIKDEIMIYLKDDTEDSRYSVSNVPKTLVDTSTKPNTVKPAQQQAENYSRLAGVGKSALNTATNGLSNQAQSMANAVVGAATNPVMLATLALTVATKIYSEWQNWKRNEQEREANLLRAGGQSRDDVNRINSRISFITGRNVGGQSTIYRR